MIRLQAESKPPPQPFMVWSTEDYVFLEGKIPRTPHCQKEFFILQLCEWR